MGEERADLVVYAVRSEGVVVYVGQGTIGRAKFWSYPSRYQKQLGLEEKPEVLILASGLTRPESIALEAEFIAEFKPVKNKALKSTTGGLVPHNKGKKGGKGGRPKGIPATEEQKRHLSEVMKGRATAWLRGKTPWNKGLTKEDPRVAKGCENYNFEKRSSAADKVWRKRKEKS